MRILNWETVRPTAVFRKLMAEEVAPFMGMATDLVRLVILIAFPLLATWLPQRMMGGH